MNFNLYYFLVKDDFVKTNETSSYVKYYKRNDEWTVLPNHQMHLQIPNQYSYTTTCHS